MGRFAGWIIDQKSPLALLVTTAYGVRCDEVFGWSKWAASVRFDIEAKMDVATTDALHKLPREQQEMQRELMLQSLLVDRFQLEVHHSTKLRAAYELVVAKGGLRMEGSKSGNGIAWPLILPGDIDQSGAGFRLKRTVILYRTSGAAWIATEGHQN